MNVIRLPWKLLVKQLDTLFSFYIRLRDKKKNRGKCFICKVKPIKACFHFISRADFVVRWEPDNACGSCKGDNYNEHLDRRQKRRDFFRQKHVEMVGEARVQELERMAREITKLDRTDIAMIRRGLQYKISKLGG